MIKAEWKNIAKSTWLKIVLCAIMIIPMIYACVFLGSMWDPYGKTDQLPVAVVNNDKEVEYNELISNLKPSPHKSTKICPLFLLKNLSS